MTLDASEEQRRAAEWELLRALCTGTLAGGERREALALLADYAFSDPIRQALFDEMANMGRQPPEILRQELPARLARRGFPDVDFDSLLAPPALTAGQALENARGLLRASKCV